MKMEKEKTLTKFNMKKFGK